MNYRIRSRKFTNRFLTGSSLPEIISGGGRGANIIPGCTIMRKNSRENKFWAKIEKMFRKCPEEATHTEPPLYIQQDQYLKNTSLFNHHNTKSKSKFLNNKAKHRIVNMKQTAEFLTVRNGTRTNAAFCGLNPQYLSAISSSFISSNQIQSQKMYILPYVMHFLWIKNLKLELLLTFIRNHDWFYARSTGKHEPTLQWDIEQDAVAYARESRSVAR